MDRFRAALRDEHLITGFNYWLESRGEKSMPSRSDIDPADFPPKALPHLLLADVVASETHRRYFHRLCGSAHVDASGWDQTGTYIDELPPRDGYRDYLIGLYDALIERKAPLYTESTYMWCESLVRTTRRLMLPLSDDQVEVSMVLAVQVFDFPDRQLFIKSTLGNFSEYHETCRLFYTETSSPEGIPNS